MERKSNRQVDALREVKFIPNFIEYPEGSVLISMGNTKVLCNATIKEEVPRWMTSQSKTGGWITGEYSLLPRSTLTRTDRETRGLSGRTQEIKRLIGRSLRAAVDLEKLGPRTCIIDCDVLQADGGTRTASITGGYVAMVLAIKKLISAGEIPSDVLAAPVAAISVGILDDTPVLDLCYEEDVRAEVDANIVMNAECKFIEVQGTAEGAPFSRSKLDEMLNLAEKGIKELFTLQQQILS